MAQRLLHSGHQQQVHLVSMLGNHFAHGLKNSFGVPLHNFRGNLRLPARIRQDRGVRAPVERDAGHAHLESRDPLDARGKGIKVDAVAAPQQRAVDVEQISILPIPGKSWHQGDTCFLARWSCQHLKVELRRLDPGLIPGDRSGGRRLIQDVRCGPDA